MKHFLSAILIAASSSALAQTGNVGIGTPTPTDQLHTTGTVRHEGYRGPGTRLVQMDSSGRMVVTGAGEVFQSTSSVPIINDGCASGSGVYSTITVGGNPTAVPSSKIAVQVNITHPSAIELRLALRAPNGQTLLLMGGAPNGGANLTNTVFTDAGLLNIAGTAAQAPYTGKFKPVGALGTFCTFTANVSGFGAFGGGSIVPNGGWSLRVYDGSNSNTANGLLNDWSISFSGPESFTTAEQSDFIPKFSEGNLVASLLYEAPGTGNIGIRDPSAPYPLTLAATGSGIVHRDAVNGVEVGTFANAAGGWLQTYSAHPLLFTTANGGAQMALSTAGNLGIGISAPSTAARLHLGATTPALLQLDNTSTLAIGVNTDIWFKTGTYYTGAIRLRGTGTAAASIGFFTNAATSQGALLERLTIADNGNVGIGNTAPFYKLDVVGNANVVGNISGTGNLTGATLATTGNVSVGGTLTVGGGNPNAGEVLVSTNSFGTATWRPNVAFLARQTQYFGNNGNFIDSTRMDSLTQEYNDGTAFSPSTGVFTAPAAGLYHFDALVDYDLSNSGGFATITIKVNGVVKARRRKKQPCCLTEAIDLSLSIPLKLAAGDQVELWAYTTSSQLQIRENSYFGGYRVY